MSWLRWESGGFPICGRAFDGRCNVVQDSGHRFTSSLQRIVDFLYRAENINHQAVVYMNLTKDTGIFEDRSNGSHIHIEFTGGNEIAEVSFSLHEKDGIIHQWVKMFREEFGATIEETGS